MQTRTRTAEPRARTQRLAELRRRRAQCLAKLGAGGGEAFAILETVERLESEIKELTGPQGDG